MLGGSSAFLCFLAIYLILTPAQLMPASDMHFARKPLSCIPNRTISLDKMFLVFVGIHIEQIAIEPGYTTHQHLIQLLRMTLGGHTFTCGLQNSSHLVHKISVEISFGSKQHAWYISSPWSPDHLRSVLHVLSSGKLASSAFKTFSHHNFQALVLDQRKSPTDQSITGPSMD